MYKSHFARDLRRKSLSQIPPIDLPKRIQIDLLTELNRERKENKKQPFYECLNCHMLLRQDKSVFQTLNFSNHTAKCVSSQNFVCGFVQGQYSVNQASLNQNEDTLNASKELLKLLIQKYYANLIQSDQTHCEMVYLYDTASQVITIGFLSHLKLIAISNMNLVDNITINGNLLSPHNSALVCIEIHGFIVKKF